MGIDNDFVFKALLQHNFFPTQKEDKEELPPVLSSVMLTPEIATQLVRCMSRKGGYDQVEYRATRHTNISRALSIPHPMAYAKLSHAIYSYWDELKYIAENSNSLIIPKEYPDGRIIVMNYDDSTAKIERHIKLSFNKKFIVHTDITNFFPSVYSHSIPWALVGFDVSKNDRDRNAWFNQIDSVQRLTKRDETNGLPIGPASSNIVSEAILARIDEKLAAEGYSFIRFIDDYTGYFDTYEKAEEFIRRLSEELAEYKLLLNLKKTGIAHLPAPSSDEWIVDLTTRIPDKKNLNITNVIRFLDYAVNKQVSNPDGSVLKYAAKTIIREVEGDTAEIMLKYLLGLSAKYPIILPLLETLFAKFSFDDGFPYRDQLLNVMCEHSINKRSDAMAWALYYLNKYNQPIPQQFAQCVIATHDCISVLMLYLSEQYNDEILAFCNTFDPIDLYHLDQYWLLLYQLYFDGKMSNPYENEAAYDNHLINRRDTAEEAMRREIQVFQILKNNGVSFVLAETESDENEEDET